VISSPAKSWIATNASGHLDTAREVLNFLVDWDPGAPKVSFFIHQELDEDDELRTCPTLFFCFNQKHRGQGDAARGGHITAFKVVL
jgi:hypothetical protein